MARYKRSNFGKSVQKRLIDIEKSQSWLIEQVKDRTGLYCDSSYMSKILTGRKYPSRLIDAICQILDMDAADEEVPLNE